MGEKIKSILRRIKRYIRFSIQYFIYEKPRGLDFTMRDRSLLKKSEGIYHGYSKSNEVHLRKIFQQLSYEDAKLLDVGCGIKRGVNVSFSESGRDRNPAKTVTDCASKL